MLRRILLFIAVLAVPLSLIAVSALPARADETPPALSPVQGPPGTKVTATAADWPGCSSMSVSAWGTTLGTTTISAAGAFSLSFTVPSNAPAGATQLQFSPTCTHSTYIPFVTFTVTKVTTVTPPVPVITSVGTYTRGVLVYFDIHYADPGHDAAGFGFVGVNGSGWAEENHPFSSPSYGIVGPGSIAYPFNEACGTAQQYTSYVEAWIYDTAGNRSKPVVIHLVCTTTPKPTWSYQAGNYAGKSGTVSVVAYKEPNFAKYDYVAGPGASQVLISAWTKNVPSIDTLATEEKTDPNPPKNGTYHQRYG